MNKKIIVFIFVGVGVVLLGIKLNNFIIGQSILGNYTSLNSEYLKIQPTKRNIKPTNATSYLKYSIAGIKFNVPKIDTISTFHIRGVYRSFKFRDSSTIKVIKVS